MEGRNNNTLLYVTITHFHYSLPGQYLYLDMFKFLKNIYLYIFFLLTSVIHYYVFNKIISKKDLIDSTV